MTDLEIMNLVSGAALKAAVILAIAGLVTLAWRSASAAARHLVWTVAVTASLAVPALAIAIARLNAPHIEIPVWKPQQKAMAGPTPEAVSPTIAKSSAGEEAISKSDFNVVS